MKLSLTTKLLLGFEPRYEVTLEHKGLKAKLPVPRTDREVERLEKTWRPRGYRVTHRLVELVAPEGMR